MTSAERESSTSPARKWVKTRSSVKNRVFLQVDSASLSSCQRDLECRIAAGKRNERLDGRTGGDREKSLYPRLEGIEIGLQDFGFLVVPELTQRLAIRDAPSSWRNDAACLCLARPLR